MKNEPIVDYYSPEPQEQLSAKFEYKWNNFHTRKYRLQHAILSPNVTCTS